MNYLELIYQEIGEIIKLIQYIEWNLCLKLEIDGFASITLGQIKTSVIENNFLDEDEAVELIQILEKRNDLIHQYFKRLDFEKHSYNLPFLYSQLGYVKNLKDKVQEFNEMLLK